MQKGSKVKYELDKETDANSWPYSVNLTHYPLIMDSFHYTGMMDPLDVLILCSEPVPMTWSVLPHWGILYDW